MLRAGTLDQWVAIQALVPVNDPEWGEGTQWQTVTEAWAEVAPISGTESSPGAGVVTAKRYRIRIRFEPGIDTKARIIWGSRALDITSVVDPDNRQRELVIEATEHPQA